MNDNFKSGLDVIYLTSCTLHGIVPDEMAIAEMDLEAVTIKLKDTRCSQLPVWHLKPIGISLILSL